ncbi:MAG: glycine cleavage T C-terminal barrel domain-containing protein [Gammaproteobacteria bacterium]
MGLQIDGDPLPGPNTEFRPIAVAGERVAHVTSAVYSPRLGSNIALAMVQI